MEILIQFIIDILINIVIISKSSPVDYLEAVFNLKNNYLFQIIHKVFSFLTYKFKNINIEQQKHINDTININIKKQLIIKYIEK